jgi:hypothetical protein
MAMVLPNLIGAPQFAQNTLPALLVSPHCEHNTPDTVRTCSVAGAGGALTGGSTFGATTDGVSAASNFCSLGRSTRGV